MYRQCPSNHYPYTIQPGDTLYSIAQRLEISLSRILAANPGIDPYRLRIGQTICIPSCLPNHTEYIIQPGDTLAKIARIFNVTVDSIIEANPGVDPYSLRIAQRICIPTGSKCAEIVSAMQNDINMLKAESTSQKIAEENYGDSTQTTRVIEVTPIQILFDAVPVVFSGNYIGHFLPAQNYPYYLDAAMGGQRGITVKDNFGVWHTFGYRVPIS